MSSGFRGSGQIGLPPNVKEGGQRVDFKTLNTQNDTAFDLLIETKCPRFGWARGARCPCTGPNPQAPDRAEPDCDLCNGLGFHYFRPHQYVQDPNKIGTLDDTQCALVDRANAVVIKCLMVNALSQPDIYTVLGTWAFGSASCTVRQGNRLGYYDRLIALDDEMVYSEIVEVPDDPTTPIKLRYPAVALNMVRSVDTVYDETSACLDVGDLAWIAGQEPAAGTRLAVHYIARPVWVVMEHTKLNRTSLVKQKKPVTTTPQGDIVLLPQQVMVRLEHLPLDPNADPNP